MRVGAVDVGTSSLHLLVADVAGEGPPVVVETAREQVELGSGGLETHRITDAAAERALAALTRFAQICRHLGVDDIHCAATSAVREAENGEAFCREVRERCGIHVRVVSGPEEARLIWLGARQDLDFSRGRVLLFDVGGGSTEFVLGDPEHVLAAESLRLGHIRLAEGFDGGEILDPKVPALRKLVRERLAAVAARVRPDDFERVVGTSGTVRTLARMATLRRGDALPGHDHGLVLRRSEAAELADLLSKADRPRILALPGMDPKRVRTLPAGAVLVHEILEMTEKSHLVTSARSLRDGLVLDWARRHRPELALATRVSDPRRRSVETVLQRYGVDRAHADHVAALCVALFDGTVSLHHLPVDDRRLLEFAALLHDVGHHISGDDHHRHGQYLVRHTHMPGFTAPEVALLGNLVRYHRGAPPKSSHPEFASLTPTDRRRVRVLCAILRLADALDRSHQQVVRSVSVSVGATVDVCGVSNGPADLEQWSAVERAGLLADLLERPVTVRMEERAPPTA
jgi:exopolyphosphatase/guanosine-5'-triphosphate,3'-diphosphate pyrophosphatase